MLKLIVVFLFAATAVSVVTAQCTQAIDPQNVCLYGNAALTGTAGDAQRSSCQVVNANPFAAPNVGTNCEAHIRADGSACVQFYAEYQCSVSCAKCLLPVCPSFCANYQSVCPTAAANDCFHGIFCDGTPGSSPQSCVDWNVNVAKIPASTGTTVTTTTTTTTHHTTTTGTDVTSSTSTTTDDDFTSNALKLAIEGATAIGIILAWGTWSYWG